MSPRWRGSLLKILLPAAGLVGLYALAGFFLAPYLAEKHLPPLLSQELGQPVSLGQVEFNPFDLRVVVHDFRLGADPAQPLVSFGRLAADLRGESLWRWAWTLREVELDQPFVNLTFAADGSLNLAALGAGADSPPAAEPPPEPSGLPPFVIQALRLRDGRVYLRQETPRGPAELDLKPLDLELAGFSSLPGEAGRLCLSALSSRGASLSWQGQVSLEPLRSQGTLEIKKLRAALVGEFLRRWLNLPPPAGELDLQASCHLDLGAAGLALKVSGAELAVRSLRLTPPEGPDSVGLAQLKLSGGSLDLAARRATVKSLALTGLTAQAFLNPTGDSAWEDVVPPAAPAAPAAPAKPGTKTKAPAKASAPSEPAAQPKAAAKADPPGPAPASPGSTPAAGAKAVAAPPAWRVSVEKISVEGEGLGWHDRTRHTPLSAALAKLSLGLGLSLEETPTAWRLATRGLSLDLHGLTLGPEGAAPALTLDQVTAQGPGLDLAGRKLALTSLEIKGGQALVVQKGEAVDWEDFLAPAAAATPDATASPPDQAPAPVTAAKPAPAADETWSLALDRFHASGLGATYRLADAPPGAEAGFQDLDLTVEKPGFPFSQPWPFHLSSRGMRSGALTATGRLVSLTPGLEADYELKGVDLTPLNLWVKRLTSLSLASAVVESKGHVAVGEPAGKEEVTVSGWAGISRLSLKSQANGEELVGLDLLQTDKLQLGLAPPHLVLADARLEGPRVKLVIQPGGVVNLVEALNPPGPGGPTKAAAPAPASAAAEPTAKGSKADQKDQAEGFAFRLDQLEVVRGKLDFTDLTLTPNFHALVENLGGVVDGLSTRPGSRLEMKLRGKVEPYGLATIEGGLQPDAPADYTQISLTFRNLDLPNLSPYTTKFAGYPILEGKLNLKLVYRVEDRYLKGENTIGARHIVLGPHEGSEGPGLPLELGLALLQDSQGRIDLDLPVEGDLNDPQVSVGGLVWQALTNFFTKLITAPFRALASLLPGGSTADLEHVSFEPASSHLLPPQQEKILKLGQALAERPSLKVVVKGGYAPDIDGPALKRRRLAFDLEKLRGFEIKPGQDPGPVNLASPKVGEALDRLYAERVSADELQKLRREMILSTADQVQELGGREAAAAATKARTELNKKLYRRLEQVEPLSPEDLQNLARERAQKVLEELARGAGLPPTRLGQGEPEVVEPRAKSGLIPSPLTLEPLP